ncbi:glycoside hydrolase family 43 protein [Paenibacillus aurantius]
MNPQLEEGPDPWVLRHSDGTYYLTFTLRDRIELRRSTSLTGLAAAEPKVIWKPEPGGRYSYNLWAPELHRLDDKWYIYYTANDGAGGDDTRRICVLEQAAADPLEDGWIFKGAVNTAYPGLDGTVFRHRGELYFFYSGYGYFPDYGSAIYGARMVNPWTIQSPDVLISAPTADWEKQGGMAINEGPVFLERNGRIHLIFSASATWSDDYCLGMNSIRETEDLLDPSAWEKHQGAVFAKHPANRVFAPGHNSFTISSDGKEDWIVYHAYSYSEREQSRETGSKRSMRIQKFRWNADGTSDFGVPCPAGKAFPVPSGEYRTD